MNDEPATASTGEASPSTGTLAGAMLQGALRFAVVSVAAFSVWAFAGRWFYRTVGELGLYVATTVVFLALSGWLLAPLVAGGLNRRRFMAVFSVAFLAYAVAWCAAWFALRFGPGEWLGSLVGSLVFAAVMCRALGRPRVTWRCAAVLFVTHSAGYFLGGALYAWLGGPAAAELFPAAGRANLALAAKLGWGLLYGLGFGAGLGFTFFTALRRPAGA